MKFVADRSSLLPALQRAARIALPRSTVGILGHALLTATKTRLSITATNTEQQVTVSLDIRCEKPGVATADARLMAQFVGGLADGLEVEASTANDKITLRAGRARITLPMLPPADFPPFKSDGFAPGFALEGAAFATQLRAVAHAQSNEETRYYLNGIYLHRRDARELVAVATNGHVLGRVVLTTAEDLPDFKPAIVPRDFTGELAALSADAGTIQLAIGGQLMRAEAGDVVLMSKLVDGTFPDYQRAMPANDVATGFEADRAALVAAAKRVGVFVNDDKIKSRPLKLTPGDRSIELLASQPDLGEIVDQLDAETTAKIPVGLNARYLQGVLEGLAGKRVRVRYADAVAPLVFTDPADDSRTQIAMAMRV